MTINRVKEFRVTDRNVELKIRDRLNFIQGVAEQLLSLSMHNRLDNILSGMSSEPDLDLVAIFDSENRVLASSRYVDKNRNIASLSGVLDLALVSKAKNNRYLVMKTDNDLGVMEGYASICAMTRDQIRQKQCGFAVYRIDLFHHYRDTENLLLNEVILFGGGTLVVITVILLLMYTMLSKPAVEIVETLHRFNEGDRTTRIPVSGYSDLRNISSSINSALEEIVRNEADLKNQKERFRAVFSTIVDAVITIDKNGIIDSVNPAVEKHLGYDPSELVGRNIKYIMHGETRENHDGYLANYLDTGKRKVIGFHREVEAVTKSGEKVPVELAVAEMRIDGEIYFTGVLRDISERVRLRDALQKMNQELFDSNRALKTRNELDALTGLYNRGYFDQIIQSEVRRADRQGQFLSLIMLDVDHFKKYNDHYGHPEGDKCLKALAACLAQCFKRDGDVSARYGGEEFVVILPGTKREVAEKLSEKLRRAVYECHIPHAESPTDSRVTVSIGVSTFDPETGHDLNELALVASADAALYRAKGSGRNTVFSVTYVNNPGVSRYG
ncbi:MAG: diguanylate cyclase [Gammaproteobacteria bacterium]|nr:diguanylate cyclase [Gammaproteobacteria bacterium]